MGSTFASYHPIVSFAYFALVIVITMFSMDPVFLVLTFSTAFIYSCMLNGAKAIKLNLKFMVPMIIFMAIINPLFFHKGVTVLFFLNGNAITLESIVYGLGAATLFTSVIIWFSCFNTIMDSDKFIYLFGRIIPSMSLVLSICLRFVPMLIRQFHEIDESQRCMGRCGDKAGLWEKLHRFARSISILISWSMENSIDISDSMVARGYGLKGRTSFNLFSFDKRDALALSAICLLGALVVLGCIRGENNILYYPAIILNPLTKTRAVILGAYSLLLSLPIIIDTKGEITWMLLSSRI